MFNLVGGCFGNLGDQTNQGRNQKQKEQNNLLCAWNLCPMHTKKRCNVCKKHLILECQRGIKFVFYLYEPKCVYNYTNTSHKVLAKQLVSSVAHEKFEQIYMLILKA